MTRTKCTDFHSYAIDIKNNKMYIGNVLTSQSGITPRSPRNYSLNYLIKNLEDGRKLISIAVNTGRFNGGVGSRKSPQFINIVSNGTEFTPLQKDLIEIISQRKNIKPSSTKDVYIMSIGIYDPKKDGIISGPQVCFELNKDILLSSIKTAKEQLKPDEIDREFVDKALNLAKGEKLERLE